METHEVVIVGAGPVGLSAAIDLRQRGVDTILLEEKNDFAEGSRAICFAKRTLEIFSRLGIAGMTQKGVVWHKGKVFHRERMLYEFDLLPEKDHCHPAFVNIQQFYCEHYLLQRLHEIDRHCLRRGHRAVAVTQEADQVTVTVESDGVEKCFSASFVLACDGAKSRLRDACGLGFVGDVFRDRFLISDIKMKSDFPSERWFWFDPPFHPGRSALLHKQPDDVWRIDLQLGWHADPSEERRPDKVIPRLRAMLGKNTAFELVWVSVYAFQSRRVEHFNCGRIFFAGDAAHQVSPFGARGANSGVQDVDNLCWKIALVLRHRAPSALLDTYHAERAPAADDNILHSSRSTNFIAPPNDAAQSFRDAALSLAAEHPPMRRYVNSGRLSTAAVYADSPLNGGDDFTADGSAPGSAVVDAPIVRCGQTDWLINVLRDDFNLLLFTTPDDDLRRQAADCENKLPLTCHFIAPQGGGDWLGDGKDLARRRLGVDQQAAVVIRPDGHVCARLAAGEDGAAGALAKGAAVVSSICRRGVA